MNVNRANKIINELREYDSEREWFEFKENWFKADELGVLGEITEQV